jgi:hypothetical protein
VANPSLARHKPPILKWSRPHEGASLQGGRDGFKIQLDYLIFEIDRFDDGNEMMPRRARSCGGPPTRLESCWLLEDAASPGSFSSGSEHVGSTRLRHGNDVILQKSSASYSSRIPRSLTLDTSIYKEAVAVSGESELSSA